MPSAVQDTMEPLYVYFISCNDLNNIKLYGTDFIITHCKESQAWLIYQMYSVIL